MVSKLPWWQEQQQQQQQEEEKQEVVVVVAMMAVTVAVVRISGHSSLRLRLLLLLHVVLLHAALIFFPAVVAASDSTGGARGAVSSLEAEPWSLEHVQALIAELDTTTLMPPDAYTVDEWVAQCKQLMRPEDDGEVVADGDEQSF